MTSPQTTTLRDFTSNISTEKTTTGVTKSSPLTTEFTSFSTIIPTENVTVENVTIVTETISEFGYSSGCKGICIIGLVTGAVCLSLLLLLVIALFTLFRRGKETKNRSRSRSRSRFGDMPDVDLYDSVDIGESSKRNSGTFLFRRSGDFSRSPPVVFDNPAYRRSFELRPRRFNSWYDPEATDYIYSQNNANLITRRSRSPERRSVSTSRLNENRVPAHRRHGSSSSWHSNIHDYVPKVIHSNSEGDFRKQSPYYIYNSQNGILPNGRTSPPNRGSLPRTPIENSRKSKNNRAKVKRSYRSKSCDPDTSGGSSPWDESQLFSVDRTYPRNHYTKQNQSTKSRDRGGSDKMNRRRHNRNNDIEMTYDRIYRTNSEGKNYQPSHNSTRNSSHRDKNHKILSSNLQPVSFRYLGQADDTRNSRSRSNSERSADNDDYYMGHGSSFRDFNSDNSRRYSNRNGPYRADNEVFMFQTKL